MDNYSHSHHRRFTLQKTIMTTDELFHLSTKMGRMCVVIIWLSIDLVMSKAKGSENEVVTISGCNETLEWTIGTTYLEAVAYAINVINANGLKIAEKKAMKCKFEIDSSMYCEVRNTSTKEWRFVMVLFNVTPASSGKYTGQLKYGPRNETNITTELTVIERPKINEAQKPIVNKPLRMTCSVDGEVKGFSYYWKLNGTYLNSTDNIYTDTSNLTFANFTVADNLNIVSCLVCSHKNCCIESESYVPVPYYGPDKVTLSLNKSDIYLKVHETFKAFCSAKCNPPCSFQWDGYVASHNEELVINSFDSRMVGNYSCTATNTETYVTVKSDPIVLHYVQDISTASTLKDIGDYRLQFFGVGLFIAAISLIMVGVLLFVMHRRKYASRRLGSQTVHKPCALSSNRDIPLDVNFEIDRRPLPTPSMQEMIRRSWKPSVNRKSRSCEAIFDDINDSWNPVRQTLSLQTLIQLSQTIGSRTESDDSISKPYCSKKFSRFSMNGPGNGIMLEGQYSKVRKNKQIANIEPNPAGKSHRLSYFQTESFDQESQETQYNTVDETSWSVYDYARGNEKSEYLHQNHRNTEGGSYDYDYATMTPLR